MFNQDITIVNKLSTNGSYKATPIKGFYSSDEGIKINNTSLVKSDGAIARNLFSEEGYIAPKLFNDSSNGWTLRKDDYIVKGIVNQVTNIASLKENNECMKITKVSIKDYGSIDMQHFEISGE